MGALRRPRLTASGDVPPECFVAEYNPDGDFCPACPLLEECGQKSAEYDDLFAGRIPLCELEKHLQSIVPGQPPSVPSDRLGILCEVYNKCYYEAFGDRKGFLVPARTMQRKSLQKLDAFLKEYDLEPESYFRVTMGTLKTPILRVHGVLYPYQLCGVTALSIYEQAMKKAADMRYQANSATVSEVIQTHLDDIYRDLLWIERNVGQMLWQWRVTKPDAKFADVISEDMVDVSDGWLAATGAENPARPGVQEFREKYMATPYDTAQVKFLLERARVRGVCDEAEFWVSGGSQRVMVRPDQLPLLWDAVADILIPRVKLETRA